MKDCKRKNKSNYYPKIRWGYLKSTNKKNFKSKLKELRILDVHKEAIVMWKKVASEIKQVAKNVLGESEEKASFNKNSWWWSQSVQEKIRNKKHCYKTSFRCKNSENWEGYKVACKHSKKIIYDAKNLTFSDLYNRLDTKEGERCMYKLAN